MIYPKQSKTVHVEILNDEVCVYDWERMHVHALNPTVARIWEMCDGQTSPAQMATQLRVYLDPQPDVAQAEALVRAGLAQLHKAALLEDADPQVQPWLKGKPMSRRELLKMGLALAVLPVIHSMVAPSPVAAQSPLPTATSAPPPSTNTPAPTPTNTPGPTPTPTHTPTPTPTVNPVPDLSSCTPIAQSDWDLIGDAAFVDNNWLRLTNNTNNQGGAALSRNPFDFDEDLIVTFEYADYGGSGADGFCVFFFDGDAAYPPTLGRYGGALTYASAPDYSLPGLSDAYVGVGFDEYGNFSNPGEAGNDGPGFRQQSVVLRGSGNGNDGYRYLTGVSLPMDFGEYVDRVTRDDEDVIPDEPRRVVIHMQSGRIAVFFDFGEGCERILDYDLTTAPGQVAAPARLRIGIGASTGGSTNYHEIRFFGTCSAAPCPITP